MHMAYSVDLRKRVLEYNAEGHTYEETKKVFKVGITTIKEWKRLLSETGSLEKRELNREARLFADDELRAYMDENPLAILEDIAKYFGGSQSGANAALARLNITLKKRLSHTANATKKNVLSL